jgi:hypothetical protein
MTYPIRPAALTPAEMYAVACEVYSLPLQRDDPDGFCDDYGAIYADAPVAPLADVLSELTTDAYAACMETV